MELTQNQITQLIGQKELDNYALLIQVQNLQQENESLKEQLKGLQNEQGVENA